jgi:hypothetical protein
MKLAMGLVVRYVLVIETEGTTAMHMTTRRLNHLLSAAIAFSAVFAAYTVLNLFV